MSRIGEVMRAVPRERFIPDLIYIRNPPEYRLEPLRRDADPSRWAALVGSDEPVVTAVVHDAMGVMAVSSSTAPWLMAQMLAALRLEPGMTVLEIGTGTGFNAACLAALGATVTSIEIDPVVADQARVSLTEYDVEVITGNGELGCPGRAPFDRVIATASTHTIPYSWVEQTRDGGLIVVPYNGEHHDGAMLVLAVSGGVARGGAEGEAHFMPLRGQALTHVASGNHEDLYIEVGPSGQDAHPRS
jgi:protein-L-isoaspartate(D-aspartate) O-methyltransferase